MLRTLIAAGVFACAAAAVPATQSAPFDFGRTMRIPDDLLPDWYRLVWERELDPAFYVPRSKAERAAPGHRFDRVSSEVDERRLRRFSILFRSTRGGQPPDGAQEFLEALAANADDPADRGPAGHAAPSRTHRLPPA